MRSGLLQAYDVLHGSYVDIADTPIQAADNPENTFMFKELIEKLSDEAKLMMSAIMNLPDEMYMSTGQILQQEINSWMKRRYHWNARKIDRTKQELRKTLGVVIL
jgi:hypothetical protein